MNDKTSIREFTIDSLKKFYSNLNIPKIGNSKIFYGTCDTIATTTTKVVDCEDFTEDDLVEGVIMLVKFSVTNSGAVADLKLKINDIEDSEAPIKKMCATTTSNAAISNLSQVKEIIAETILPFIYTGTYWIVAGLDTNVNTNTIGYSIRYYDSKFPTTDTFYRYRLLFTAADNIHYVPANTSTSTKATTAKTVNQKPINPFGDILYYSTKSVVNEETILGPSYLWLQYGDIVLGYSFNITNTALELTVPAPIYVKCAPQSDGSAIIDANEPYVQQLPSTEDGKIYIFLGVSCSTTAFELSLNHPVYYYHDGAIRLWANSEGVNQQYVNNAIANLVNSAPETLDTLNELATTLGNDPNFATTIAGQIGEKVSKTELSNQSYVTTTMLSAQSYLKSFTESDPTVPTYVKEITESDITYWNTKQAPDFIVTATGNGNSEPEKTTDYSVSDVISARRDKRNIIFHWNNLSLPAVFCTDDFVIYCLTVAADEQLNESMPACILTVVQRGTIATFTEYDFNPVTFDGETDPTVPSYVKEITESDITNWNNKLGSFTESDPVFIASAAHGITSQNISDWNDKVSKTDLSNQSYITTILLSNQSYITSTQLSNQGYLKSFTETDPTVPSYVKSITSQNISDWNDKISKTQLSAQAYLQSETDPIFTQSAAHGITSTDIDNWNAKVSTADLVAQAYLQSHATHKLTVAAGTTTANSGNSITFIESLTGTSTATSGDLTLTPTKKTITIPAEVTESTVSGWGFTKNATANNATITIQKGGTTVDSFTTDASSNKTINIPNELPSYSSSDSGKVLSVNSSGQLVWISPAMIYSGSDAPNNSQGNNGDIYLQM